MIYLKNILEEQEVYIPRQDQGGEYVSPCEKCYGEGYEQGYADGSNIKLEQGDIVVTADTMTVLPSSGYSGFESVDIDATEYGQDKYDDGYASGEAAQKAKLASTAFTQNGVYNREDGWNEVEVIVADIPARVQEKTIVVTAATETVYPDSGYEGISSAYVDATAYGQSQYQSGTTHGEEVQKAKLTSTAFTQNGVYNRTDGWDEVEVIVPQSGSPCSLESGVTFPLNSGFTQTTVTPSSGYDGISDITIYDNGYGQERYDGGYTAGRASVSLESKTETITADTQTIYPSSGYDGMSSVDIDASGICGDYYGSGWTEGYNEGQADCPSFNLQDKSVVMTATTDTFYPDQMAVADVPVIGIEIPSWDEKYCIDTNINPTSSMTIRIKYQGRGVYTDRLIGTYPNFLGVPDDDHDYRTFDAQGWVDFDILNGRFENLETTLTHSGDGYDITMSTDGVYDNINEEWIVQGDPRYYEPDTGYTICVDVGTVFVKEVIIEDNDTELFHGTPSVESGEAGLYDSVSDSFFGIYSGADVPLVLYADYDGISEISVDATTLCGEYYNSGYTEGRASVKLQSRNATMTAVTQTFVPTSGFTPATQYDGMSAITVDATQICQDNYNSGYTSGYTDGYASGNTDGYSSGYTDAQNLHSSTAFTHNGTYENPDGWSAVTVDVEVSSRVIMYKTNNNTVAPIMDITHPSVHFPDERWLIAKDQDGNDLNVIGNIYVGGWGLILFDGDVVQVGKLWYSSNTLTEIVLPEGLEEIADFAEKCSAVSAVTFPTTLEVIGHASFSGCNLTSITLSDNITTIGVSAFENNNLTAVTIGSGCTTIGQGAFRNDYGGNPSSLKRLYCNMVSAPDILDYAFTPPTSYVFYGRTGSGTLYVPNGSRSSYEYWLNYLPSGWTISATL